MAPTDSLFTLVRELLTAEDEDSWHRLVELGPPAAPAIALQIAASPSTAVRRRAIEVLSQLRRPADVQVFAAALADPAEPVWQAAIDALLAHVTAETQQIIEAALARATAASDHRKADFLLEALHQVTLPNGSSNVIGGHA
jgi:hypothetical protein